MRNFHILFISALCLILFSCSEIPAQAISDGYIPVAPDYSDSGMWRCHTVDDGQPEVSVFYVPSTWEFDWTTSSGEVCHYADPSLEQHRADMAIEIDGVADYMADGNNFYSPYYRHITLDTWATLDEQLIDTRYQAVSFVDVKNAFDYFIPKNRPFILAGFSQGGKSVVELMKTLTPEQREKLVAAYVMGYKVTPEDVAQAPWIKGAQGADDTGVTICYNSVSDVKYTKPIVAEPNVMAINPVNWKIDSTPAILNDTITVTLNTDYNVLVVEGYDGSSLPNILDILNTGDYHGAEPWLYSDCLGENIKQRVKAYNKKH